MIKPQDADILFGEIRPEGENVSSEEKKKQAREYYQRKKAQQKAMKLATGEQPPAAEPALP